jgi:BirA family biotin operon repressor/biotin-[acetyl-CoA-carboxylase] ligase
VKSNSSFWRFSTEDLERVRTATFVSTVRHEVAVDSTNTQALLLATDPQLALPALVVTDRQTAGRGRGAHRWWSADGALTCSLVLRCPETRDVSGWPRVALTTGIAVCEALHQLCPALDAAVKWPNDVYVQGRKICGILVEIPPQASHRMVVGMGVNVNNRFDQAPAAIRDRAATLRDVAGYPFRLTDVLIAILGQLAMHLPLLVHDPVLLQRRWDLFCMLTGKTVELTSGSRKTVGTCQGIDARGALLVQTEDGACACSSGEVTRWDF